MKIIRRILENKWGRVGIFLFLTGALGVISYWMKNDTEMAALMMWAFYVATAIVCFLYAVLSLLPEKTQELVLSFLRKKQD